jgi:hypothetical protein
VLPRFEVVVDCPDQAVADNLARTLADETTACTGWVQLPYAELHVPKAQRHFWSPLLQVILDARPEGTHLHCTFRPAPGVWTGFVFAHCVFGVLALCGLCLGLSQWTIGQAPTAMVATPIAVFMSLGLYFGALRGHALGADQMRALRRDFDRALGQEDPTDDDWDPTVDTDLPGPCALLDTPPG